MLHGCNVINRVVQIFGSRINFPTAVARPRLYRDNARRHNGAADIGAHLRKPGDGVCPARLPGQMKTFQAVADFHFIERRHDDTDFKQGSSFAVLTRGTKRPQTSNGDVGSAINSRPALYVALLRPAVIWAAYRLRLPGVLGSPRSPWTKTTASSLEPPAVDIQ